MSSAWTKEPPTVPGDYEWRWVDGDYRGPVCHVRVVAPARSGGYATTCESTRPENPGTQYGLRGGEWREAAPKEGR